MHCATLQALTFAPRRTFLRPVPALLLSSTFFFAPLASAQSLRNSQFQVAYSPSGVTSLKHVQDKYDTDYVAAGRTLGDLLIRYRSVGAKDWRVRYLEGADWKEVNAPSSYGVAADHANEVAFAPVTTSALRLEAQLQDGATAGIFEWAINGEGKKVVPTPEVHTSESFRLQDNALLWTISLQNTSANELEIGDLALPLQFNTQYVWD